MNNTHDNLATEDYIEFMLEIMEGMDKRRKEFKELRKHLEAFLEQLTILENSYALPAYEPTRSN